MMEFTPVGKITPLGELGARLSLLMGRLESPLYRPDRIFTVESGSWPGDWEGRTILALTLSCAVTGKTPAYLRQIIEELPSRLNEKGYLGKIYSGVKGSIDEQQLSGHSWLLRGLCEYYDRFGEPFVYDMIRNITVNLFLPATSAYDEYPVWRKQSDSGEASGNIVEIDGRWRLSTDTGCAFIALDGISAVFELSQKPAPIGHEPLPSKEIGQLLDLMLFNFFRLDITGLRLQTHATLTAVRGILRAYDVKTSLELPCSTLLAKAREVFDIYLDCGMSATFANYNWFGRPEWTEPCAIFDSFMVAMQLFKLTGEVAYLSVSQKILYNAIGHAQRPNGGFGCDSCVGGMDGDTLPEKNSVLSIAIYEAFWCCTMRGGEGLARAAQYAYLIDDDTVTLPYLLSSEAEFEIRGKKFALTQTTDYPDKGTVRFDIRSNDVLCDVRLRIYLPEWVGDVFSEGVKCVRGKNYAIIVINKTTTAFTLSFDIPLLAENVFGSRNAPAKLLMYGNLILGTTEENEFSAEELLSDAKYSTSPETGNLPIFISHNKRFLPIASLYRLEKAETEKTIYRVLF